MKAEQHLQRLLDQSSATTLATMLWPIYKPRFKVSVDCNAGVYTFWVSYPPMYRDVTQYSLSGLLYLMQSAYPHTDRTQIAHTS
jgi:hypothetical protein